MTIACLIQLHEDIVPGLSDSFTYMGDRKKSPTEAFGEVLRELRPEKGLTQERLVLDAETGNVITAT
jgi:hypothetical protein